MKRIITVSLRCLLASAIVVAIATNARASLVNVANGKPVIGGSGSYNGNPYNVGTFPAGNVTDGVGAFDPFNNTGPINENNATGYWLGSDGVTPEYFVLDLGSAVDISQIDLFNTHNDGFNDRATGNFTIEGANAVTFVNPTVGFDIVGGTTIVNSFLAFQADDGNPLAYELTAQSFAPSTYGPFRYIKFNALQINPNATGGQNGVGLNEIRIFATVPEPSTLLLLLSGLGAIGFWMKHRRAVH